MTRFLLWAGLGLSALVALIVGLAVSARAQEPVAAATSPQTLISTPAAPEIFASPIHGGCYIAGPSECHIHVEPFTINIAFNPGISLVESARVGLIAERLITEVPEVKAVGRRTGRACSRASSRFTCALR